LVALSITSPVLFWTAWILAPGMAAPEASVTWPEIVARKSCAERDNANSENASTQRTEDNI
jgi:hypothetical protein